MSEPTIQERIALAIEARADKLSATFPARQRPAVASGMIEGYRTAARIARETIDPGWIAVAAHGDVRADAGGGDGMTWEGYNR